MVCASMQVSSFVGGLVRYGTCLIAIGGMWVAPHVSAEKTAAAGVDKFRQLGHLLRDPNVYRNAAGAPGHEYWQQQADYKIKARLDEEAKRVTASLTLTYANRSPDALRYLWLQLDQNRFRRDSLENRSQVGGVAEDGVSDSVSFGAMRRHQGLKAADHGYTIAKVSSGQGRTLPYTIVDTMMRIDLPRPLRPGASTVINIDWSFAIVHRDAVRARGGYERFEETDTYIYFLAQWFPRMAAYTDYTSWQHKQFLGGGEFTLEFGDYDVELKVPADHIVASTGELKNGGSVLTATQRSRMNDAKSAAKPLFIVTPDEARDNQQDKAQGTKTWRFSAKNVRDFAWASSRKFVWDARGYEQKDGPHVMAMSFYPPEAEPIWSKYSTEAVIHTMDVYSRFSFPYPYPTAQSVNTWERGGMEYPMITFNGYRPKPIKPKERKDMVADAPDATYDRSTKHALIGVIIHEIGHIYFPMAVNSDEREWTWMDEGINSFLEYLAELEWEENFHAYRELPSVLDTIGAYMVGDQQVPIMTQSDSVLQLGPNAYTKPTAALVVLRETVLGRELFDYAFKEYARRWRFKRPTPADFFRTMEDASGVDLDWFWRGWFYTTDHVDIDLAAVREYQVSTMDPNVERNEARRLADEKYREPLEQIRNREEGIVPRVKRVDGLDDFYNENDQYTVSNKDLNDYQTYLEGLEDWERQVLQQAVEDGEFIYFVDFVNVGGLLSPLPLRIEFQDGKSESFEVPAQVWRRNSQKVTKLFILPQRIKAIELDPLHQTADVNRSNNHFPRKILPSRLELFKLDDPRRDLMKEMLVKLKAKDGDADEGTSVPLEQASDGK